MLSEKQIREALPKILKLESRLKDKDYERKIDVLIPKAMAAARKRWKASGLPSFEARVGACKSQHGNSEYQWCRVSSYFHEEMNRMAKERGLRGC